MSETVQNQNKEPLYKRQLKAAALVTALAIGGGTAASEGVDAYKDHKAHSELVDELQKPGALGEYLKGDSIPHDQVERLEVPAAMPADTFAKMITKDDESQWDLTQQIEPQVDAQGDPGAQPHEQVIVEKSLVSEQAVEQFGVVEINDPQYIDPDPASHQ
jgi:hypothetical protein